MSSNSVRTMRASRGIKRTRRAILCLGSDAGARRGVRVALEGRAEPPAPIVHGVSSGVDLVRVLGDMDDRVDGTTVVTGRGLLETIPRRVDDAPLARCPLRRRLPCSIGRKCRSGILDLGHELLQRIHGCHRGGVVDESEGSDAILSSRGVADAGGVPGFPRFHRCSRGARSDDLMK